MPLKSPKLTISKDWLVQFCKAHHIVKFALFGSVLTDRFTSKSDVDILVEFDPLHIPSLFSMVAMKDELSKILGREVDLRTPEDISKFFRNDIIEQSYLLYEQEGLESA